MQLIHIDPESSAESIRRRLPQIEESHVVLELPDGWSELDNMARMRMLQRQSQILGIDLAIVTRHPETRRAAKQVGIPIFHRPEQALSSRWKMSPLLPLIDPANPAAGLPEEPHWDRRGIVNRVNQPRAQRTRQRRINEFKRYRQPAPRWMRWIRSMILGSLMGLLLIGFLFYILPAATVTLVPGQEPLEVNVEIVADPNIDVPDFVENRMPARLVEKNIDEFGTIATSGSRQKASAKAQGQVTFSNLTSQEVVIRRGTIVNTSTGTPVQFETLNQVTVPAGFGQKVDVSVEAVEPGFDGNVLPNTVNTVSGVARLRVSVTNRNGMFGGGSQLVPIVSQSDRDALLEATKLAIESKALGVLQAELEPGEWMPPDSVQTFVIAQAFTHFNDEETNELGLNLRILARGAVIQEEQFDQVVLSALQSNVPERGQLVAETLAFQRNPGGTNAGNTTSFSVNARGDYVIPVDPAEVRTLVAGKQPTDAVELLQQRWLLASPPTIYRDPELLPTLPNIESRIQVRIDYQGR